MFDYVHLDEKWFYLTHIKKITTCYKGRNNRHKKWKASVLLFLCAVARPRYDHHRKSYFDGKIGLWLFVERVLATMNPRNPPAGTLEAKPITLTQDVYRSFLLEKAFPAVMNKWPAYKHYPFYVQKDNARAHIPSHDQEIREKGREDGSNIGLFNQPANSPDFNILDLGVFNPFSLFSIRVLLKISMIYWKL